MSALEAYVAELRRQRDALEVAADEDSSAKGNGSSLDRLIESIDLGQLDPHEMLHWTAEGPNSIRALEKQAVSEAAANGTLAAVAPKLQAATAAHSVLIDYFRHESRRFASLGSPAYFEQSEVPWGPTVEEWCAALAEVEFLLPASTPPNNQRPYSGLELVENLASRALAQHAKQCPNEKMTQRRLAKLINCSHGTVGKTTAWRVYQDAWSEKHPPKPKVYQLSDRDLRTTPVQGETLSRLIEEQKADQTESRRQTSRQRSRDN